MKTKIHDGKVIGDWTGCGDYEPTEQEMEEYEQMEKSFFNMREELIKFHNEEPKKNLIITNKKPNFANKTGDFMECDSLLTILADKGFKITPPKDLPKDKIIFSILDSLEEIRIIGRNVKRDIIIRSEYVKLKQEGKTSPEARQVLIDKPYKDINGNSFYLSENTIRNILYSEKRKYNAAKNNNKD